MNYPLIIGTLSYTALLLLTIREFKLGLQELMESEEDKKL